LGHAGQRATLLRLELIVLPSMMCPVSKGEIAWTTWFQEPA
jgi:hypothetical protein